MPAQVYSQPLIANALTNSSGNVAATATTATLTSAPNRTVYLTGFEVTGAGATAGSVIVVTVTGTLGGTLTYNLTIPTGATVGVQPLTLDFSSPIPASAPNTNIVVNVPSFGAGSTNAAVNVRGYII